MPIKVLSNQASNLTNKWCSQNAKKLFTRIMTSQTKLLVIIYADKIST